MFEVRAQLFATLHVIADGDEDGLTTAAGCAALSI